MIGSSPGGRFPPERLLSRVKGASNNRNPEPTNDADTGYPEATSASSAALKLDADVVAFDDHLVTGDALRGGRG
jgi:hypothetical protein